VSKTHNITTIGGRRVTSPGAGRGMARRGGRGPAAPAGGALASAELMTALTTLGQEAATTVRHLSEQRTVRRRISAWERTEIARLREAGLIVREHLAAAHGERQVALAAMTRGIEAAIAAGDLDALVALLESTVSLLETTPLAELAKVDAVAAKLGDPKAVWTV
jgi:hypothetical protein